MLLIRSLAQPQGLLRAVFDGRRSEAAIEFDLTLLVIIERLNCDAVSPM